MWQLIGDMVGKTIGVLKIDFGKPLNIKLYFPRQYLWLKFPNNRLSNAINIPPAHSFKIQG